ncbi:MAG: arginine deiminase [Clostridiaceae bacterium]|nr:arginine deiminase [Eubacteriales bacterium]
MEAFVNQISEIGTLKTVLLHRPDVEVSQIIPEYLEQMLAEDTPYVPGAQKEHDIFSNVLRDQGVEVLYLRDMFCEAMKAHPEARTAFVDDYILSAGVPGEGLRDAVRQYLLRKDTAGLFFEISKGVMRRDLDDLLDKPIQLLVADPYPFVSDPVPNAYFTRDIGTCVGSGMIISSMSKPSRMRETLVLRYVHKYHPRFAAQPVPLWYDGSAGYKIEGGDILVLSDKTLAIGCGERTCVSAVECVADRLLHEGYERVLLFNNPRSRKYMHLDVLFTMVDRDKFLVHPYIANKECEIYELTAAKSGVGVSCVTESVEDMLKRVLRLPAVKLIHVGGGDPIATAREHWNMGSNSLTVSPGNVITYDRNDITNELLVKAGVKVNTIPGSELARGRGGPRCMSMPIHREA